METLETVKIVCDAGTRGWKIINKSDLKESDKIYTDEKKPKAKKAVKNG